MSEIDTSDGASIEGEKPVQAIEDVKFPPFPAPTDDDFDDDLTDDEKAFYKSKFPDLNAVANLKLHCTACDRHLGCSAKNESRMRPHPMLRTLICHTCHSFYNSGEFDKGEDGSELYCRWCGQGGQVYCCSDCIYVFCAKCIKRNLGVAKIKEIENTDDWKCFKCNPRCLWETRAVCWALLRFCDLRNKVVFLTQDPELKEKYQRAIAMDNSECCKNKGKRKDKTDSAKKKEKEPDCIKKVVTKLPPTIQVKKFASINLDDTPKKNLKRPASPKMRPGFIQKPISIAPCNLGTPPMLKKIRLPSTPMITPVRFANEKKITNTYTRMPGRPRQQFPIPIVNSGFNGLPHPFSINMPSMPGMPNFMGDNINLSLETLTQGLDMAAVAAFNNSQTENDTVVCTPDFPLEPLCEVTEDNDDDVECITPGPAAPPKSSNPPPLVSRSLPDLSSDNIVQMTENDVTVNSLTGGLKFRVDPQTLSSKKMYRLPDGRIFAINPNPNMPGGYSATIVTAVPEGSNKVTKGGETYAAKLSAIAPSPGSGSNKTPRNSNARKQKAKSTPRSNKSQKTKATPVKDTRECDLKTPVEWYRYNLIDAVDALDYSLSRLHKLKKEATTSHLRTRTVDEMKYLHRTLEQLLTTSSKRFIEIRDNLNKELKQYVVKKTNIESADVSEDDDDDVEFLPNAGNDDPIFIDENSVDSVNENQEVDLTGAASSEHNDSTESKNLSDPLLCNDNEGSDKDNLTENVSESTSHVGNSNLLSCLLSENIKTNDRRNVEADEKDGTDSNDKRDEESTDKQDDESNDKQDDEFTDKQDDDLNDKQVDGACDKQDDDSNEKQDTDLNDKRDTQKGKDLTDKLDDGKDNSETEDSKSSHKIPGPKSGEINGDNGKSNSNDEESMDAEGEENSSIKDKADPDADQADAEMSAELIEALLKGDALDGIENNSNTNSLDIPEKQ